MAFGAHAVLSYFPNALEIVAALSEALEDGSPLADAAPKPLGETYRLATGASGSSGSLRPAASPRLRIRRRD